jgi:hypothetical protein
MKSESVHDLGCKPLAGDLSSLELDCSRVDGNEAVAEDLVMVSIFEAKG